MNLFQRVMMKVGLKKAQMPETFPHIAVYSLIILNSLVEKSHSMASVQQAIDDYPEDTHREGPVCKGMTTFVTAFQTFEHLKLAVEQQFEQNGGRSSVASQQDSMERLESWYDE